MGYPSRLVGHSVAKAIAWPSSICRLWGALAAQGRGVGAAMGGTCLGGVGERDRGRVGKGYECGGVGGTGLGWENGLGGAAGQAAGLKGRKANLEGSM